LVYRICRAAHRALDGEGARLYGGRWNSPGLAMVYASSSLSLAALEYLVHVDPTLVPSDLVALAIDLGSRASRTRVDVGQLPPTWQWHGREACVARGNQWLAEQETWLLEVPAAPIPEEANLLLNPGHRQHKGARIVRERPFAFDPRLLP
jgi:RES domain-containing protein